LLKLKIEVAIICTWKLAVWGKNKLKPGLLAEPVLVGRECELEQLHSLLNLAIEGKGNTILISGEAGSGKTRLTAEFLKKTQQKGVSIMAGWCLCDSAAPYFPFVEAFRSYFTVSEDEEQLSSPQFSEILPSTNGTALMVGAERGITAWLTSSTSFETKAKPESVSPQVWKDQVYAGVVGTLHSISIQTPVILFLEDIHWADSASLALLNYIARTVNTERILVIATFRSEELTADAEGRPHPLAETLRLMRREDLFTEIKLESLSQINVAEIAKNMIGGKLQQQLTERLTAESRGNPLFVVESLRMLFERKSLFLEDNQWRLAVDEFGIPSKIKDIILRRLGCLKYAQRRVLDAASVIGEKFDADLLSAVLGMDYLEVLETLNLISNSTSLVSAEENCYRFDHARSRETLYEELSPPLKRGYHQRIAERLEGNTKKGLPPYSDLAYHYAQAGNFEKAEKYSLAAGQDALEKFSNTEAIKYFVYILQTTPETVEKAEVRKTALEGLGDAYYANGRFEDAIRTFEELANSATGKLKLRAYIKEMEAVWFKGTNPDSLLELAKKAETYADLDPLGNAYIRHNRGRALLTISSQTQKPEPFAESLKEHEESLRIFKQENYLPKTADLLFSIGTMHKMLKMHEKGFGEMLQGMSMFHELGDVRGEMMVARRGLGLFFSAEGLPEESAKYFTLAYQIGEKIGSFGDMAVTLDSLGIMRLALGDIEGALALSLKALKYSNKTDAEKITDKIYWSLIIQYSMLGNLAKAEEFYKKLMEIPKESLNLRVSSSFMFVETALLCANGLWQKAEQNLVKMKSMPRFSLAAWQMAISSIYTWALLKQGKTEEAKAESELARRAIEKAQEKYSQVNIRADLMAKRNVAVGEEFEIRLDLVNVSRTPGLILSVQDLIPNEFEITSQPTFCNQQNNTIEIKDQSIDPWQVKTVKLKLKATKPANYVIHPNINYTNKQGENKSCKPEPIAINVSKAQPTFEILPGRLTTGYWELDRLLLGGIPEKFAIILSSPTIDEKELLVGKFLETGVWANEITFNIAVDAGNTKNLAPQYPSNLYLLVCNRADTILQNLPNVFTLKGIENLTEIDIALTKMFRTLDPQATGPRRACIEIISDALLQHHTVNTRRWLSALLQTFKSKGFTILATINPQMHQPEESQAIKSLFDGEIEIFEKTTTKTLKVRRLSNQRYLEEELPLKKEGLAA
jgi:tetratricopeptide (TPR) repeat protein